MNPTIIITMVGVAVASAAQVVVRRGSRELAKAYGSALMRFPWDGLKAVVGITNADDLDEAQFDLPEVKHYAAAIAEQFAAAGFKATIKIELEPQPLEALQS